MSDGIQIISRERMMELIRVHEVTCKQNNALLSEGSETFGLFLAKSQNFWIACDNTRGDCWVEEFDNQRDAIKWLWGQEDLPLWKSIGLMKPITYEEAAETLKNSKVWNLMYKHPDEAESIGELCDAAHFAAAAITEPRRTPRIPTATDILKLQKETDPARTSESAFHERVMEFRDRYGISTFKALCFARNESVLETLATLEAKAEP